MKERDVTFYGVGLLDMLFITFLVLKLTGIISWSWWWVTAPLWAPIVLITVPLFATVLITLILDFFTTLIEGSQEDK